MAPKSQVSKQPAVAAKKNHPLPLVLFVSFLYMGISVLVVVLNKKCFAIGESFPFPLATTWFQMVVALACTILVDIVQRIFSLTYFPKLNFRLKEIIAVIPVSVAFIAMIATGNMCLSFLQISFFQTAKSLHIIFSLILSYFVFHVSQSKQVTFWAVLVTVGWIISTSGEPSKVFSLEGVAWGVASSFMVALYPIVLQRVMVAGLDKWQLGANNSLLAIVILVPVVYFSSEWPAIATSPVYAEAWFWQLMIITAVAGFVLNFAAMANVHYSSPLSHMIAGSLKGIIQSLIAWLWFHNQVTLMGGLGSALCIVAIFGYSLTRYYEQQAAKKKE